MTLLCFRLHMTLESKNPLQRVKHDMSSRQHVVCHDKSKDASDAARHAASSARSWDTWQSHAHQLPSRACRAVWGAEENTSCVKLVARGSICSICQGTTMSLLKAERAVSHENLVASSSRKATRLAYPRLSESEAKLSTRCSCTALRASRRDSAISAFQPGQPKLRSPNLLRERRDVDTFSACRPCKSLASDKHPALRVYEAAKNDTRLSKELRLNLNDSITAGFDEVAAVVKCMTLRSVLHKSAETSAGAALKASFGRRSALFCSTIRDHSLCFVLLLPLLTLLCPRHPSPAHPKHGACFAREPRSPPTSRQRGMLLSTSPPSGEANRNATVP